MNTLTNYAENYTNIIFHIDVNSAFLSWSAVKKLKDEPGSIDLRTVPSAVGGDVKSRHGIITAKSIPAKKYGIVTGEPVVKALQKCPELILVPGDFNTYREYSRAFIEIISKYSPLVQQVSIDEAYIDMSGTRKLFADSESAEYPYPLNIARLIRDEVRNTLGFTVNVGISSNKLLAKMASDFQKPDKTHTLFPEEVETKMWPLPIGDLYGCGKSTASRLYSVGIRTIGDAANADPLFLISILGENGGSYIYTSANGIGSTDVSGHYEDAKSYSNETTLSSDLTADSYDKEIVPVLKHLSGSVSRRLKRDHVYGQTVTVSVKTGSFKRHSCQMQVSDLIDDELKIYEYAKILSDKLLLGDNGLFTKGEVVRLVGVGVSKIDDGSYRQMSLFDMMPEKGKPRDTNSKSADNKPNTDIDNTSKDKFERQKRLDKMSEAIDSRYGKGTIFKGSSLK